MRIKDEQHKTTNIKNMKDGDIAIIVSWAVDLNIGTVIQRYKDNIVPLGKESGCGWSGYFHCDKDFPKENQVRILPKGTTLEI